MRRIYYLLIFFGALLSSIISCSKDQEAITAELVVSTETISLSNGGETKVFHVKSNVDWTVSSSESWLTLTPTAGGNGTNKIEATVAVNPETADRRATITVQADNLTRQIMVVQTASALFSIDQDEYTVGKGVQDLVFSVESNAAYIIEFDGEWMSRKSEPVVSGPSYQETILIKENGNIFERAGIITLKRGNETLLVNIKQEANPLTIPPVSTGVSADAVALAGKLRVGWNLGNSLEAAASPTSASETMWGNPKTTEDFIQAVKAAGFNAVRIPCAWSGYMEDQTTYRIKDTWLARVKEVVDYCVDNDMYAIINMHWDGGWLEEHPLYNHQEEVGKKQKALWEQIAVYFRDYDEHLLFAGTNEVRANYNTPTAEHLTVQQYYNQNFVDAVRATGGRNAYRNLIVQAYNTNIRFAVDYMQMPEDLVTGRLIAEVHYYDPYDFSLDIESNKYLWGAEFAGSANVSDWGQEAWVDTQFADMKAHFIDRGIPVILGEYGATYRALTNAAALQDHKKARANYLKYVTGAAIAHGLIPFYWDSGHTGDNGSGLFDRNNGQVVHQDALNAIMEGVN
ncbi:cellulase family glycosylhydrolase [Sphingobacterium sp. DN00404]|uniref:Cellulase family glycosylhydrolase n=1 Tax=Sphingobacterium micropteri TaxID=2763501 RepID=A0ABR7YL22_9SPHI|nr:cellulase family glycosylhydrolase [Sphingobacterium micropteri]MBD1432012.1 cellulase family glycosylhydrolase [Sphingobacterium micropteri]